MNMIKIDISCKYLHQMDNINSEDIIEINKKAIIFERFIIRRAYGLYYLIWAFALLEFILVPIILFSTNFTDLEYLYIIWILIYFITLFTAIKLTKNLFSKIYRTYKLEYGIRNSRFKRINYVYMLAAVLLLVGFAYFFQRDYFYYALFLYITNIVLFTMGFRIFEYIKLSFQNIPVEGYIAVYSYITSAAGTMLFFITSSFFLKNLIPYSFLIWIIALAGWFFSSYYAVYHAPDEVVANE